MALPQLNDLPKYDLVIPSTKESVTFRPFLVKEQKVLLMALEAGDDKQILRAILDTIAHCLEEKMNVDKLATFDIEYIFLKLRANSVSTLAKLQVWDTDLEDYQEVEVDLDKVECEGEIPNNVVDIGEEVKLELRPPSFTDLLVLDDTLSTR